MLIVENKNKFKNKILFTKYITSVSYTHLDVYKRQVNKHSKGLEDTFVRGLDRGTHPLG